jgi:hypothetical protein
MLRLSPGGGDEAELREFDLGVGQFVDGCFRTPASHASMAMHTTSAHYRILWSFILTESHGWFYSVHRCRPTLPKGVVDGLRRP